MAYDVPTYNGLIMEFVDYFKERKNYWFLPTILLLSLVFSLSSVFAWTSPIVNQPYCKNLTIVGGSNPINDFVSYVNVSYSSNMQSNLEDIRIYDQPCENGGNELPYEFDNVINSDSAGVWIKSNLNTGNNYYSIYYGNSTIGNGEQPNIVWSDYNLVYHFSEGSGTLTKDSSSSSNNATFIINAGTDLWNGTGIGFGKGLTWNLFDTSYLQSNSNSGISGNMNRTVMIWYSALSIPSCIFYGLPYYCGRYAYSLGNQDGVGTYFSVGDWDGLNTGHFMIGGLAHDYKPNVFSLNNYKSFNVAQKNSTTAIFYQDKFYDGIGFISNYVTSSDVVKIGAEFSSNAYGYNWVGDIDEFRISNITFSQDYLDRNVDNQNMSMFNLGTEENMSSPIIPPSPTPTPTVNNYETIGAMGYGISAMLGGLLHGGLFGFIMAILMILVVIIIVGAIVLGMVYLFKQVFRKR